MIGDYDENRPRSVRCVYPLVTLLEKLDAMTRRYDRDTIEANSFVRHYEDSAQIILSLERLPAAGITVTELARDMVTTNDLRNLPSPNEPAFHLANPDKQQAIDRAHLEIALLFWGPRIPLGESCAVIRSWIAVQEWSLAT